MLLCMENCLGGAATSSCNNLNHWRGRQWQTTSAILLPRIPHSLVLVHHESAAFLVSGQSIFKKVLHGHYGIHHSHVGSYYTKIKIQAWFRTWIDLLIPFFGSALGLPCQCFDERQQGQTRKYPGEKEGCLAGGLRYSMVSESFYGRCWGKRLQWCNGRAHALPTGGQSQECPLQESQVAGRTSLCLRSYKAAASRSRQTQLQILHSRSFLFPPSCCSLLSPLKFYSGVGGVSGKVATQIKTLFSHRSCMAGWYMPPSQRKQQAQSIKGSFFGEQNTFSQPSWPHILKCHRFSHNTKEASVQAFSLVGYLLRFSHREQFSCTNVFACETKGLHHIQRHIHFDALCSPAFATDPAYRSILTFFVIISHSGVAEAPLAHAVILIHHCHIGSTTRLQRRDPVEVLFGFQRCPCALFSDKKTEAI